MIQINKIEAQYLKLHDSELTVQQFETWLYANESTIQEEIEDQCYVDLISIDFKSKEAKYKLLKELNIDLDLLLRHKVQIKLVESIKAENLSIQNVKYEMLYDLQHLTFSFQIGNTHFLMQNPFGNLDFDGLNKLDLEKSFSNCFNEEERFLNMLIAALETNEIRLWNAALTQQFDRMTEYSLMLPAKAELSIVIDGIHTFIKKDYLRMMMQIT